MRTLATLAILAMCAAITKGKKGEAIPPNCDVPRLLAAIVAKENNAQDHVCNRGERSIYCITESVWRQHMADWPFSLCTEDQFYARLCAIKHINWLANELAKTGIDPDCYALASAWNVGLSGFVKLNSFHQRIQFGQDVENLYNEKPL